MQEEEKKDVQEEASQEETKEEKEEVNEVPEIVEEKPKMSQEQMDEYIVNCLYYCLAKLVKKSDLPLEPSQLLSNFMNKWEFKDQGKIDFRNSSFKKIGKFLRTQSESDAFMYGPSETSDHDQILFIDTDHPLIKDCQFGGWKKLPEKEDDGEDEEQEYPRVEVQQVWKPKGEK